MRAAAGVRGERCCVRRATTTLVGSCVRRAAGEWRLQSGLVVAVVSRRQLSSSPTRTQRQRHSRRQRRRRRRDAFDTRATAVLFGADNDPVGFLLALATSPSPVICDHRRRSAGYKGLHGRRLSSRCCRRHPPLLLLLLSRRRASVARHSRDSRPDKSCSGARSLFTFAKNNARRGARRRPTGLVMNR